MNEFTKKRYTIIHKGIPKTLANFIYQYFSNKRKVSRLMLDMGYIPRSNKDWGEWNEAMFPNTYGQYGDLVMETLLEKIQPIMEKEAGYKLYPNFSYARIYKKGDELLRHKDRLSCEISATMCLGGDPWRLFIDPTGKGKFNSEPLDEDGIGDFHNYEMGTAKGDSIIQEPGDMLMYHGCELEHWREPFEGNDHGQVFFHFNDARKSTANKYDGRPFLGLPQWFRQIGKRNK